MEATQWDWPQGKRSFLERFIEKIRFDDETGCWMWEGATYLKGYGQFYLQRDYYSAHRVSYEYFHHRIPDGLQIDHLCRTPPCVNPEHLEVVTGGENQRRGLKPEGNRARARLITQCPRGHVYTEPNTYLSPAGWRACRVCHRDKERQRKAALRAICASVQR